MLAIMAEAERFRIAVRVVPNASRDKIVGWIGEELKVKLQAPPEGGRANKALTMFLCQALELTRRNITIIAGKKSRHKTLEFSSLTIDELKSKIHS